MVRRLVVIGEDSVDSYHLGICLVINIPGDPRTPTWITSYHIQLFLPFFFGICALKKPIMGKICGTMKAPSFWNPLSYRLFNHPFLSAGPTIRAASMIRLGFSFSMSRSSFLRGNERVGEKGASSKQEMRVVDSTNEERTQMGIIKTCKWHSELIHGMQTLCRIMSAETQLVVELAFW